MIESLRNIAVDIFKLLSAILILVFFLGKVPSFKQMFFRKPATWPLFSLPSFLESAASLELTAFLSKMRQLIPGRSQSS